MSCNVFSEVTDINKQKFLAELSKLLTFMYEEDKQNALSLYARMFDKAIDETALLQLLVSPTRQAVIVARAYNAKERKLHVQSQSRMEADSADGGEIPDYVRAINQIHQTAVSQHIIAPEVTAGQFTLFSDDDADNTEAYTYEDILSTIRGYSPAVPANPAAPQPASASPAEPVSSIEPAIPAAAVTPVVPVVPVAPVAPVVPAAPVAPVAPVAPTAPAAPAERSAPVAPVEPAAPVVPADEQAAPATVVNPLLAAALAGSPIADILSDRPVDIEDLEVPTEPAVQAEPAVSSEPTVPAEPVIPAESVVSAEPAKELPEDMAPALEEALPELPSVPTEPIEATEPAAPAEPAEPAVPAADAEFAPMPEEPVSEPVYEEENAPTPAGPAETVRKAKIPLLILYIILAIPVTLIGVLLLLIPTLFFLALGLSVLATGSIVFTAAFSGFAVLADIMVVLGVALVVLALGLLFLWIFIWFIGGAIVGLVRGVIELGRNWCFKEVAAE